MSSYAILDIEFPNLAHFLLVAAEYLVNEMVFFETQFPPEEGTLVSASMKLPAFKCTAAFDARVTEIRDDGVLLAIQEWRQGHRDQVWRAVAIGWTCLRSAGHKRFKGPAPGPAADFNVAAWLACAPHNTNGGTPLPDSFENMSRHTGAPAPSPPPVVTTSAGTVQSSSTPASTRTAGRSSRAVPVPPGPVNAAPVAAQALTHPVAGSPESVRTASESGPRPSLNAQSGPTLSLRRAVGEVRRPQTPPSPGGAGRSAGAIVARPLSSRARRPYRTGLAPRTSIRLQEAPVRHEFSVALDEKPLVIVLKEMYLRHASGWLEVSGPRTARRIRIFEGSVVQIEQRPHPGLGLIVNATKAVGLNWRLMKSQSAVLEYSDAPEEMMVSLDSYTRDQGERILSRRLSVQLARAIEKGWAGEAYYIKEKWRETPSFLLPDPPVPIARMIWDGLRAWSYSRSTAEARTIRERVLCCEMKWSSRNGFRLADATHRIEEQDLILHCQEDLQGVIEYLAGEGREDRMALATVWNLVQLELLEHCDCRDKPTCRLRTGPLTKGAGLRSTSGLEQGNVSSIDTVPRSGDQGSCQRVSERDTVGATDDDRDPLGEVDPLADLDARDKADGQGIPTATQPGTTGASNTASTQDADLRADKEAEQEAELTANLEAEEAAKRRAEEARSKKEELEILDTLIEKEKELTGRNHFEILNLHWSAHPDEIAPAFKDLLAHYRHYTESDNGRLVEASQALIRRLVQAYEVLNDTEKRRRYREILLGEELEVGVKHAMDQGGLHYLRGQNEEALHWFERAADMAPDREDCRSEVERQRRTLEQTDS